MKVKRQCELAPQSKATGMVGVQQTKSLVALLTSSQANDG